MVNFYRNLPLRGQKIALFALVSLLAPGLGYAAPSAKRYKKQTVVDFEGALVEGKSRKPYSAYLTQQKDGAFGDLHQWQPDFDRLLLDAKNRMDRRL